MTHLLSSSEKDILYAASIIQKGGTVAFGTETVYGLGADATNNLAVEKIYKAKGRPSYNPLIIHFASINQVFDYVEKTDLAVHLAQKFWPGPLTLILKKKLNCPIACNATAGLTTMAVRVPHTPVAQKLIDYSQIPIAAPSANPSGKISPSCAQHVINSLHGKIDAIIDSGPCQVGLESTILDLSSDIPTLLRPGGISIDILNSVCGTINLHDSKNKQIVAPGQLNSHYAPHLKVRLNVEKLFPNEALLAFGNPIAHTGICKNLSPEENLEEAAQNLFDYLHDLDFKGRHAGLTGIAVMPIPTIGIGMAINDRLKRAAAPR